MKQVPALSHITRGWQCTSDDKSDEFCKYSVMVGDKGSDRNEIQPGGRASFFLVVPRDLQDLNFPTR